VATGSSPEPVYDDLVTRLPAACARYEPTIAVTGAAQFQFRFLDAVLIGGMTTALALAHPGHVMIEPSSYSRLR
jgi:hypothetical protein